MGTGPLGHHQRSATMLASHTTKTQYLYGDQEFELFLYLGPGIHLDMSSYNGTEDGGGSTVTVCAVFGNLVAMTMGGPELNTSDIITTFSLTDGTNASKNEI